MSRKITFVLFVVFVLWATAASQAAALTLGGAVRQPLNLGADDLGRMESVSVRLNELTRDKEFRGVFTYRGVPLRSLLDLATVQKETSGYSKAVDLAVVVRGREGKTAVLSWGEVFYRNPSDVVVAYSGTPLRPHTTSCTTCHGMELAKTALDQLDRKVGYPKLVVANDFFTERSIEDVVNIEVVDLKRQTGRKDLKKLFAPKLTVVINGRTTEITDLSGYKRTEVQHKEVGDGRGYHGLKEFSGVPLRDILAKAGIGPETDRVILASAPDGYRCLFSYGEVFLAPQGARMLVADRLDNRPIDENGKFFLVPPDDLAADRDVKSVDRIEVVSMPKGPGLYVISMGCADTSLITLEAISYLGRMDAVIVATNVADRFGKYLGGKSTLFDPFDDYEPMFMKKPENAKLSPTEAKAKLEKQRAGHMEQIRAALKSGKKVALLDWGDPTLFGGWQNWLGSEFPGRIEVVTGVSSFSAANAMIAHDVTCRGSAILTWPEGLKGNDALVDAVAKRGDTLAIFMALKDMKSLVPLLGKHYPTKTPVYVAYHAGYSNGASSVRTTLGEVADVVAREKEKFLGIVYIGECVGKQAGER